MDILIISMLGSFLVALALYSIFLAFKRYGLEADVVKLHEEATYWKEMYNSVSSDLKASNNNHSEATLRVWSLEEKINSDLKFRELAETQYAYIAQLELLLANHGLLTLVRDEEDIFKEMGYYD